MIQQPLHVAVPLGMLQVPQQKRNAARAGRLKRRMARRAGGVLLRLWLEGGCRYFLYHCVTCPIPFQVRPSFWCSRRAACHRWGIWMTRPSPAA